MVASCRLALVAMTIFCNDWGTFGKKPSGCCLLCVCYNPSVICLLDGVNVYLTRNNPQPYTEKCLYLFFSVSVRLLVLAAIFRFQYGV